MAMSNQLNEVLVEYGTKEKNGEEVFYVITELKHQNTESISKTATRRIYYNEQIPSKFMQQIQEDLKSKAEKEEDNVELGSDPLNLNLV